MPEENSFDYTDAMLEAAIDQAVAAERERCAKIADTEPECPGEMPPEFHLVPLEDAIRAAVRAIKKSIARRIRAAL